MEDKDPYFRDQDEFGKKFENNLNYLIFRTQSVAVEYLVIFLMENIIFFRVFELKFI